MSTVCQEPDKSQAGAGLRESHLSNRIDNPRLTAISWRACENASRFD